jgi:hypothetical protein
MMGKLRTKLGVTTMFASVAFLPIIGAGACDGRVELETQTFELQYMNPSEAVEMIAPYVYPEREGAPGLVTHFTNGVTVRETRENLGRIQEVLTNYDLATPAVRLHFQVIEANGYTGTDARIQDVQRVLEDLFRFEGYRLLAEPKMAAMEGSGSTQRIARVGSGSDDVDEFGLHLQARIEDVRGRGSKGSVVLSVELQGGWERIETSMAVPVGETVVLGSSQGRGESTLILTVRPEFVDVN